MADQAHRALPKTGKAARRKGEELVYDNTVNMLAMIDLESVYVKPPLPKQGKGAKAVRDTGGAAAAGGARGEDGATAGASGQAASAGCEGSDSGETLESAQQFAGSLGLSLNFSAGGDADKDDDGGGSREGEKAGEGAASGGMADDDEIDWSLVDCAKLESDAIRASPQAQSVANSVGTEPS